MVCCSCRVCQWHPGEYVPLKTAGWKGSAFQRRGKGLWPQGLPSARDRLTDWLNFASSRRHELSDCNWESNCFPTVWPGCRCAGDVHAEYAKERSWLGGKFCCLPLRDEVLPFSFADDQTQLRLCLSLPLQQKERENRSQETGDCLCPGLQSPVFQCVSTRCEREDICGCANLPDTNSPPFSLGTWTVKWNWWWSLWP